MSEAHFCTCTGLERALNPNSPRCREQTCDRCIKKCLRGGEIPACFFKDVYEHTSGNSDWSYRGFAAYLDRHGRDG